MERKNEEKEGVTPRFFADSVTDELMGISADMTPEERFLFHRAHIHQDDMEMFLEYSDKLSEERTEIVYRYIHPISGEMYVRCSGKRDFVEKDRVCIIGFHQDISRTVRMEKEKMAEKRLAEQNYTLRKEHLLQRDYYKDLLDVQNCGLMAYTFPGHRLIHMNAEALRIYGYTDIAEVQSKLGPIIRGVYYPDPGTIDKLKALRNVDDNVEYECIINKDTEKESDCNIRSLYEDLKIITEGTLEKKHLKFEKNLRITHENVIGDSLKLKEIFVNILGNAVKYTPEYGKVVMTITEIEPEKEGCATFRTVIGDSGIGMKQEYLEHIFEPFSREKTSSESGVIGTGLGLSIVKSLVEMMDGRISVESEEGKGTRFTVVLSHPVAQIKEQEEEKMQNTEVTCAEELKGKRILVAEDNALNAEIILTILKDYGIEAELAVDGDIVIDMLKRNQADYYDMILMDIQMPHMDGYEATKVIRRLEDRRAEIPIVAMTANAFEEDRKAAFAAGMNGHVAKPIEISRLLETMAELLS